MRNLSNSYSLGEVVDCSPPEFARRTYLEQRDLRALLSSLPEDSLRGSACEIGSGYARMTVVLNEFFLNVIGYEREVDFVEISRKLVQDIVFERVESLEKIPSASEKFNLTMTFTTLQHLVDAKAESTIGEIKRITAKNGWILLCEETDPVSGTGGTEKSNMSYGRTVDWYARQLQPFTLVRTLPRTVESTYHRKDTGTFMLFSCN
jgi:hypothetical protein